MKRLIPIVLLAATAYGHSPFDCSVMKSTPLYGGSERVYTGRIEDRVNLWPIAYYREPALSVAWPIFSLTDDHLAIRPIYSQYRQGGRNSGYDEFNFLWPFCQFDTKHDQHRIFPLFWGEKHVDLFPLVWWKKDRYFNVFPLWWSNHSRKMLLPFYYQDANSLTVFPFYGRSGGSDRFTEWYGPYGRHRDEKSPEQNYDWCFPFYYRDTTGFATPLFGWDHDDCSSWAFPFYYKDHDDFVSLPWISSTNSSGDREWIAPLLLSGGESGKAGSFSAYLLGLAGHSTDADGKSSRWLFPLFYHDDNSFLTPFYGRIDDDKFYSPFWIAWNDAKKKDGGWCVPPLLSWGTDRGDEWTQRYLFGLYGREGNGEDTASWLFPLYYSDKDRFVTPLYGQTAKSNWLAPLWWKDESNFISLLWCWNRDDGSDTYVVPPLLSWAERSDAGVKKMRFLLGLGGVSTGRNADDDCSWAFPLYYSDGRRFISLLFGHEKDYFTYVTPLFGITHEEHKNGAWFWPLFGWANDTNMEAAEAQLNAERLDPKIAVKTQTTVYAATKYAKARTNVWYGVTGATAAHDESWRLSGLSTSDRWIDWWESQAGKTVTATDRSETGNIFAYKSKSCREVAFDVKTRKKIRDDEEGESGVFCNFLWHSKYEHVQGGRHYDKKSILWRFWHYENTNGDVSVDSFPFFTYDSKTNGYSKTSLCWRLFRNEYDPKTDKRAVDFLFVPVWR